MLKLAFPGPGEMRPCGETMSHIGRSACPLISAATLAITYLHVAMLLSLAGDVKFLRANSVVGPARQRLSCEWPGPTTTTAAVPVFRMRPKVCTAISPNPLELSDTICQE